MLFKRETIAEQIPAMKARRHVLVDEHDEIVTFPINCRLKRE